MDTEKVRDSYKNDNFLFTHLLFPLYHTDLCLLKLSLFFIENGQYFFLSYLRVQHLATPFITNSKCKGNLQLFVNKLNFQCYIKHNNFISG